MFCSDVDLLRNHKPHPLLTQDDIRTLYILD